MPSRRRRHGVSFRGGLKLRVDSPFKPHLLHPQSCRIIIELQLGNTFAQPKRRLARGIFISRRCTLDARAGNHKKLRSFCRSRLFQIIPCREQTTTTWPSENYPKWSHGHGVQNDFYQIRRAVECCTCTRYVFRFLQEKWTHFW